MNKILLIALILAIGGLVYFYTNSKNKVVELKKVNYLEIDDSKMINLSPSDYIKVKLQDKRTLSEDLSQFLLANVDKNECFLKTNNKCSIVNSEYNFVETDLNNDNVKEYIVMPFIECGCDLRGASGNGVIAIIKKTKSGFKHIGYLQGNGFTVLKSKTDGFNDILSHSHGSASSGVETLYKYHNFSNGDSSDIYEEVFSKRYDLSRVIK